MPSPISTVLSLLTSAAAVAASSYSNSSGAGAEETTAITNKTTFTTSVDFSFNNSLISPPNEEGQHNKKNYDNHSRIPIAALRRRNSTRANRGESPSDFSYNNSTSNMTYANGTGPVVVAKQEEEYTPLFYFLVSILLCIYVYIYFLHRHEHRKAREAAMESGHHHHHKSSVRWGRETDYHVDEEEPDDVASYTSEASVKSYRHAMRNAELNPIEIMP